jgi:predicted O-methyltransferase YrrM
MSLLLPNVTKAQVGVRPIADWKLPPHFLNPGELETIVALVRLVEPQTMVEIGVNTGRTARVILGEFPRLQQYIGIDVEPGYVPVLPAQRNEVPNKPGIQAAADPRFRLLLAPRGSLDLGPADLGPADAVFIDGDHSAEVVMLDTALARAIVQPGGIIIWHDYHDLPGIEVREVLESFSAAGHSIMHVAGTWLAFERDPRLPAKQGPST